MIELGKDDFRQLVKDAIDGIPEKYAGHIKNLGFVVEDDPSPEQRQKLHLHDGVLLFGLYEGIPLTRRSNNYSGVLPDKITIFKNPIEQRCDSFSQVREQVNKTIWHEVAHYFGLDHEMIRRLETK